MSAKQTPPALLQAFAGRARGELDFIFIVASLLEVRWEHALALYHEALKEAGTAAMARIAKRRAARERSQ